MTDEEALRDREASWSRGAVSVSTKDWALGYAVAGFAVLPLAGKIPRTGNGVHDASADADTVTAWWQQWPDANIGIRVDPDWLVLDCDPRNGASVDDLDLPETTVSWSGRGDGGGHFWFWRPGVEVTGKGLPEGWDLKAKGYCVVPPSIHPDTGGRYVWGEATHIGELPAALLELLRRPEYTVPAAPATGSKWTVKARNAGYAQAALDGEADKVRTAKEGTRNHQLNESAFSLGQLIATGDLNAGTVTGELIAAARAVGLADDELVGTIRSGLEAGMQHPRHSVA